MLRRSKTSSNAKKRHSMFIDFTHSMLSGGDPAIDSSSKNGFQNKNRSLDTLAIEDDLTLQATQQVKATPKKKTSKLKRSSIVLDNTLLRDYNLAINHFENPASQKIQSSDSNGSISSNSSKISSLFSESSLSIRDLLYEDVKEQSRAQKPMGCVESTQDDCCFLFDAKNEDPRFKLWKLDDDFFDFSRPSAYSRTNIEFD